MQLETLQEYADILNDIDWEMTPEDAVTRYLEWGSRKLSDRFLETAPSGKGVFPLNEEIREWLEEQL